MSDALKKELAESQRLERQEAAMLKTKPATPSEDTERRVTLQYDPYDVHNPLLIVGEIEPCHEYPEGAVLKWVNPVLRNSNQGWAGWELMEYGDEYTGPEGEHLAQYIGSPPTRMTGFDKIDNYVRRGDLCLARIDKRIYVAREHNREAKSKIARMALSPKEIKVLREGVTISGPGMTDSERPRKGFKIGETKPVLPPDGSRLELLSEERGEDG